VAGRRPMSPNQLVGVASAPSALSTESQSVDDEEAAPEKCEKSEATMHSPTKRPDSTSLRKALDNLQGILFSLPTGVVFSLANNAILSTIEKRLASIESDLHQLVPAPGQARLPLNDTEQKILAAVATKPLKGSAIARRIACGFNSSFRSTLGLLVRTGFLGKGRQGYFVPPKSGQVRIDSTEE
jgi:hypothetical protein